MRLYIKKLLEHYQKQVDRYGAASGELMRENLHRESPSKRADRAKKPNAWKKVGSLMVDITDPLMGKNEVYLQLLQEYAFKLRGTAEALRAFEELEQLNFAGSTSLTLFLNNSGIPERIIVEFG